METGLIAQAKMYGKIWCIVLTKKSHKVLYILPGLNTQISTANSLSFSTWDSCPLMNMLHPPTFPPLLATASPLSTKCFSCSLTIISKCDWHCYPAMCPSQEPGNHVSFFSCFSPHSLLINTFNQSMSFQFMLLNSFDFILSFYFHSYCPVQAWHFSYICYSSIPPFLQSLTLKFGLSSSLY